MNFKFYVLVISNTYLIKEFQFQFLFN